jgi:hypothetical protein
MEHVRFCSNLSHLSLRQRFYERDISCSFAPSNTPFALQTGTSCLALWQKAAINSFFSMHNKKVNKLTFSHGLAFGYDGGLKANTVRVHTGGS